MSPERGGGIPLDRLLAGWVDIDAKPARMVWGLCHDSRKIRPGDLFLALAGSQSHGMKYAAVAADSGACAILYDPARGGDELALVGVGIDIPCIP
ncbi:partial UDP-N-acetylmuramoyl-L-alanyl-D-glutamate--2, 6-diaminopimelate ligase, partial [Gammaproteobacteria bacterium]